MQFSKAEPIPALDKVTLGESLVYAHTSYRKPSLPFPPHPLLRVFHHDSCIRELFTDRVGSSEITRLFRGIALFNKAINFGVRDGVCRNLRVFKDAVGPGPIHGG